MRFAGLCLALALVFSALGGGRARAGEPAWFGAAVETVTPEMMAEKGLAVPFGARVTGIEEGGPAAAAGFAPGDVVIGLNGAAVTGAAAFEAAIGKLAAGAAADLLRMRGKEAPESVKVTLAAEPPPDPSRKGFLGVDLQDLTAGQVAALGLGETKGVRVVAPREGGPAAAAGLLAEDVIVALDGAPVKDMASFVAGVGSLRPGRVAKFALLRQARRMELTVVLGERPQEPAGAPPMPMLDTGGHMALIKGLVFTPDGRFIVSASNDKTIRAWDWPTGKTARVIRGESGVGEEGKIFAMALSPDGTRLAVGGWLAKFTGGNHREVAAIRLYDFATGKLLARLVGHENVVQALAFSPDGRRLVSGSQDKTAIVWDLAPGPGQPPRLARRLKGHADHIYAVAFATGGRRVVTGSFDHTLRLWDADPAAGAAGTEGVAVAVLEGHGDKVQSVAVSPKDGAIASGDRSGEIRLWTFAGEAGEFGAGPKLASRVLANQGTVVGALAFSPDGSKLLSTCGQGHPCHDHVWDVASGQELATHKIDDDTVIAAAISPDGRFAATGGGQNQVIHVWDLATGARVDGPDGQPLVLAGTGAPVWAVGFSPDGTSIAWGRTWARASPLEFRLRLPAPGVALGAPERIGAAPAPPRPGLPPGGEREKSSSPPPASRARDFLRASATHGPYALRPRKGGDYGLDAILDVVKDGKVVASLERGTADGADHRAYTFTPDGKTIVSGGSWGVIQSFDLAQILAAAQGGLLKGPDLARLARPFAGHEGDIWAVAPSLGGKYLISGSADQAARLWNLATGELIVTLFHGRDGEWAMWTPQGYYTGSPKGGELVGWQINKGPDAAADYVRGVQLRKTLLRPDIVERAIVLASAREAIHEAGLENVSIETLATKPRPAISLGSPPEAAGGRAIVYIDSEPNPLPILSIAVTVGDGKQETKVAARQTALPPGTPPPEKGAIRRAYEVALFRGQNTVRVVATNAAGESEPREVAIVHNGEGALDKRGTLWVLAVGADKYPGAKTIVNRATGETGEFPDLRYAGADAAAFAETAAAEMAGRHAKTEATILVNGGKDGEPTRANILAALQRIAAQSGDNDTVVILLAGHGENWPGGRYHVLPTDFARADANAIGANVLDWADDIQPAIVGARGRKVLFLDACHSGNAYNRTLLQNADADRFVAFSAAGAGESALEFAAEGHGVFTYMLIEGLRGAEAARDPMQRAVTVYRLGAFVSEAVATRTNGKQNPEYRSGQGNFVLARE